MYKRSGGKRGLKPPPLGESWDLLLFLSLLFLGLLLLDSRSPSLRGLLLSLMIGTLLGERESLNLGILGPGLGVRGPELILLRSASREGEGDRVGEPVYCSPGTLY